MPIDEMLTAADVAEHNSRKSCWVVVQGQAYDVTDFLDSHPGGAAIILRYAGKVCIAVTLWLKSDQSSLGRDVRVCAHTSSGNDRERTSSR
jgi:cytochrome b involved in lipid metabolism